jgi:hypothetical protein
MNVFVRNVLVFVSCFVVAFFVDLDLESKWHVLTGY